MPAVGINVKGFEIKRADIAPADYAQAVVRRLVLSDGSPAPGAAVYIQSFPTKSEKLPVSKQGGSFPIWGPDGRELFYTSPDNKVMVVDVKFGPTSASVSTP